MDSCQTLRKYYGQVMKVNFGESHLDENQTDLAWVIYFRKETQNLKYDSLKYFTT